MPLLLALLFCFVYVVMDNVATSPASSGHTQSAGLKASAAERALRVYSRQAGFEDALRLAGLPSDNVRARTPSAAATTAAARASSAAPSARRPS